MSNTNHDGLAPEVRNCTRFRILVMGRRNAGKTTILQRITDSEDGVVVVHDKDGNTVQPFPVVCNLGLRKLILFDKVDASILQATAEACTYLICVLHSRTHYMYF